MSNINFGFGTSAGGKTLQSFASTNPSKKDHYFYHVFKHIQNPGSINSYCNPEDLTHQCVANSNSTGDSDAVIYFNYESALSYDKLNIALTSTYKDETARSTLINSIKLNRPFGYLEFKFPDYWFAHSYVIVKTLDENIPDLSTILNNEKLPQDTKSPQHFGPASGGGRRKTKSRSHKKRRSTRRNKSRRN